LMEDTKNKVTKRIGFIKEYLINSDQKLNEKMNQVKFLIINNILSLLPSRFIKN